MIIAFVDNPIQTLFVYILLLIFSAVVPLTMSFVTGLKHYYYKEDDEDSKHYGIVFSFMGLSIGYYLVCLISLFTIGGFNNFQDLRNLVWLAFGTILTALAGHFFKKMQEKKKE